MKSRKLGSSAAVERIKLVFTLCGQWPLDISSKFLAMLYNCYGLTVVITCLFIYNLTICIYIFFTEDMLEATDNLCIGLTLIAEFGKLLNFRFFLQRIQTLLRMNEEFQLENDRESEFVDGQMVGFNKLVTFYYCLANVAVSFNSIGVLMTEEVRLLYLAWFPFDWKSNSTAYAWVYTYQVVGVIFIANLGLSLDLFAAYLMHAASIQFDILGIRLQELGTMNEEDGRPKKRMDRDLIRCISIYQRIWK